MGNHVVIEKNPLPVNELLHKKEDFFNLKLVPSKETHVSSLHIWRLTSNGKRGDEEKIVESSVRFSEEKTFKIDNHACYILLHIYRLIAKEEVKKSPPSNPSNLPSLSSFLSSTRESLTPRGLSQPLHCESTGPSTGDADTLYYNLYVWNGKKASSVVTGSSLSLGITLQDFLKQNRQKKLQYLFCKESKISVHSMFQVDIEDDNLTKSNENHLFQLIFKVKSGKLRFVPVEEKGMGSSGNIFGGPNFSGIFLANGVKSSSSEALLNSTSHEDKTTSPTQKSNSQNHLNNHHSQPTTPTTITPTPTVVPPLSLNLTASNKDSRPKFNLGIPSLPVGNLALPRIDPMPSPHDPDSRPILKIKNIPVAGDRIPSLPVFPSSPSSKQPQKYESMSNLGNIARPVADAPVAAEILAKQFDGICSEILPGFLFLGAETVSKNLKLLRENGVTHILNCAGTICQNHFSKDLNYRTLFLTDGKQEDVTCLFYEVIDWIEVARKNGGKVFIHCQQGVSRSSTMAICYLMWRRNENFQVAHENVKEIRGSSSPNPGFVAQLLRWWTRRSKPIELPRIFEISPHSTQDMTLVPRPHDSLWPSTPWTSKFLYTEGSFVLVKRDKIFIWRGKGCSDEAFEQGPAKVIQQFRRYETDIPSQEILVHEGDEPEEFWGCFQGGKGPLGKKRELMTVPSLPEEKDRGVRRRDEPLSPREKKENTFPRSLASPRRSNPSTSSSDHGGDAPLSLKNVFNGPKERKESKEKKPSKKEKKKSKKSVSTGLDIRNKKQKKDDDQSQSRDDSRKEKSIKEDLDKKTSSTSSTSSTAEGNGVALHRNEDPPTAT